MSSLRHDYLEDRWILYAPERGARRSDCAPGPAGGPVPTFDPGCPFCPGNESALPAVLAEVPAATGSGWLTRVVPNRYPILGPPEAADGTGPSLSGAHEVVIETSRHDLDLADLGVDALEAVVRTYRERCRVHEARWPWCVLFRNYGPEAGSTLRHAHAQLIATGEPPRLVRLREDRAHRHFAEYGRCYLCEVIERAERERVRMIADNRSFVAFVPYAAEVRCEVWLAPRRHAARFGAAGEPGLLAALLRDLLGRLRRAFPDPAYNLMVLSASDRAPAQAAWHWFVRLRPHLGSGGGFELASGIPVNTSLPERDAALLRGGPAAEPRAPERP